ncbi:MAG: hypothetical protein ABEI86_08465, partial [Halobacteriaceae archaeon]
IHEADAGVHGGWEAYIGPSPGDVYGDVIVAMEYVAPRKPDESYVTMGNATKHIEDADATFALNEEQARKFVEGIEQALAMGSL